MSPMPYIAMLRSSMVAVSVSTPAVAAPPASSSSSSQSKSQTMNSRQLSLKMSLDVHAAARQPQPVESSLLAPVSLATREGIRRGSAVADKDKDKVDLMLDTRLLILSMYGEDKHVPWRDRFELRFRAVLYQSKNLVRDFVGGIKADLLFLVAVWWFIVLVEGYTANSPSVFYTLFEIVSSFGSVGLSLGSYKDPSAPCSFAYDLLWYSKLALVVVQIAGRSRDMPRSLDSVLTVISPIDAKEVLNEEWLSSGGGKKVKVKKAAFRSSSSLFGTATSTTPTSGGEGGGGGGGGGREEDGSFRMDIEGLLGVEEGDDGEGGAAAADTRAGEAGLNVNNNGITAPLINRSKKRDSLAAAAAAEVRRDPLDET
jgi:hypothetical protein